MRGDGDEAPVAGGGEDLRLPEGCVAHVLSLTTPRDVCRLSAVCTTFRNAADSNSVWERFLRLPLPMSLDSVLAGTTSDKTAPTAKAESSSPSSKRELFFSLCDRPMLLAPNKNVSFWIDRRSGGRCFMLSARSLSIVWGDTPQYWRWIPHPDSRFAEVAELLNVCWLEIRGKFDTTLLSRRMTYGAYLVFKVIGLGRTFSFQLQETMVAVGKRISQHTVCLAPDGAETRRNASMFRSFQQWSGVLTLPQQPLSEADDSDEPGEGGVVCARCPVMRSDGWMEVEMGDFFNSEGNDGDAMMSLTEIKGQYWKRGLIVQGIEIRPRRQ